MVATVGNQRPKIGCLFSKWWPKATWQPLLSSSGTHTHKRKQAHQWSVLILQLAGASMISIGNFNIGILFFFTFLHFIHHSTCTIPFKKRKDGLSPLHIYLFSIYSWPTSLNYNPIGHCYMPFKYEIEGKLLQNKCNIWILWWTPWRWPDMLPGLNPMWTRTWVHVFLQFVEEKERLIYGV